jgi:hypothetical protein
MGLAKAQIFLVPFDSNSPSHIERMRQQRIACGWNSELVEKWCDLQKAGKKALQWVVGLLLFTS